MLHLGLLVSPLPGPSLHVQPRGFVAVREGHSLCVGHPDSRLVPPSRSSSAPTALSWVAPAGGAECPAHRLHRTCPRAQGPWAWLPGTLAPRSAFLSHIPSGVCERLCSLPVPGSTALTWHTTRAGEAGEGTRKPQRSSVH